MASIEREFAESLKARNAPPRDIAYAAANIPQEFWDVTRTELEVTPKNKPVYDFVTDFVDNIHNRIAAGIGLTLIDAAKTGKTLFGCAIIKSAAIDPETMRREYRVQRINYDSIIEDFSHLRGEQDTYTELRNGLIRTDILFLDSISYTNPPGILLSIARTRRDFRKSTILATSIPPVQLEQLRTKELFDIFKDINAQYTVNRK